MSRIFLSHIEKDLPIMQEISRGLEAAGYRTWYFERDVLPGTSYLTQITCAIEQCDALVLIISPDALNSDQVTKEVVGAFERRKPFFPVLVDITPPQLKERQPEWRHALGGTAMFTVGEGGISAAIARIIDGLKAKDIQPETGTTRPTSITTPQDDGLTPCIGHEGERKQVTVLFTDLSGFVTISEKLDPEEVREIMGVIFTKITQVVTTYEGFIEKYVGDAVMALFGVPYSHEDDAIRAIRAAREIHDIVKDMSPSLEKRIGKPLFMHTGINTGLVITGDVNPERGTHGILGDTINVAQRLSGLAKTDEIIVGHDTYRHAERYFEFKKKKAVKIKGKEDPVQIYKVLTPKEASSKTHRLSGIRAELIGRKAEMSQLKESVESLKQGKSSIFSIVGDAGTGKSRLVEEFKNSLDLNIIQWREGHSYGYSQNIPYFPLIDLLNRAWQIREGDSLEQLRQKMEKGATAVIGERKDLIPYLGRLYSLSYPEIAEINPESWKVKLHEAMRLILANLCRRAPTIVCIEDLHWADVSSVELLRNILIDLRYPVLFICICRPAFSLFTSHQISSIKSYYEVRLHDLTPTDAQDMVESLLKTVTIPKQLRTFIRDKAEGNPFYLEEVINSLIETETLVRDDGSWKLTRPITERDIPTTIQGVISARLDRLERETKKILQEASVIGRSFLYEILQRISDLKAYINKSLMNLEQLDLIKTRSLRPELEYIFKHALTQEVVYQGLLIKERRSIHEKIGLVMEELFKDRLPEFYETLAYHYSQSENHRMAFEYLKLSGDKAARNYANWEAIRFYKEAIQVLDSQTETKTNKREKMELSLSIMGPMLIMGYPEDSGEILFEAEKIAQELADEECLSKVYASMSYYHTFKGNPSLGLEYAEKCFYEAEKRKDLDLMIQSADQVCFAHFIKGNFIKMEDFSSRTISIIVEQHREKDITPGGFNVYASLNRWLGLSLGWMGELKEGKEASQRGFQSAHDINDKFEMAAAFYCYSSLSFLEGDVDTTIDRARASINYVDEAGSDLIRGGTWSMLGAGYYLRGEYEKAQYYMEKALTFQKGSGATHTLPWIYYFLAANYYSLGDMQSAKRSIKEALKLSEEYENNSCRGASRALYGFIMYKTGSASLEEAVQHVMQGISMLKEMKLKPVYAIGYLFLGELFSEADRKRDALENLKTAEALYQEMEVTPQSYWLVRIQDALRRLESEAGTTH